MRRMYTWKDIEIELRKNRTEWPKEWADIHVYSDCVEIYSNGENRDGRIFAELFGRLYDLEKNQIVFPLTGQKMDIIYEEDPQLFPGKKKVKPLFKSIYTTLNVQEELPVGELPVPVLAFHSYKGGVGRTLSLISFAREITEQFAGSKRILIVDADIEAPGLTWMAEEQKNRSEISYLDILSLLHSGRMTDELIQGVSQIVEKSMITFETEHCSTKHFFIPVYQIQQQLLDIYASPEKILESGENKFILAEFFSALGKELKADVVLMDLRAGISEYSAPYIFDPRVKRYFITSTSWQSVMGSELILQQVMENYRDQDNIPQILLTMIPRPDAFSEERVAEIRAKLMAPVLKAIRRTDGDMDTSGEFEGYITEFGFDDDLIHLEGISQVCEKLKKTAMRENTDGLVEELFGTESTEDGIRSEKVRTVLKRLHDLADMELTAEGSLSSNMLCTEVIQKIERNYRREIPRLVVLGAKGSGKTYLYKQLAVKKSWNEFVRSVNEEEHTTEEKETLIVPVLASADRGKLIPVFRACIENVRKHLKGVVISDNIFSENERKVKDYKGHGHGETEWQDFWRRILLETLGIQGDFTDLEKLLEEQGKRIIYILDGIENIFYENPLNADARNAIQSLARGMVNEINELGSGNTGIIIFLRKDLAEDAITQNFDQFHSQFSQFELSWSQTEALRLALWLAMQAEKEFDPGIPIMNTSRELIEKQLNRLWGLKLGRDDSREAFSSRWIIAALSDFTGQLQARDIVRFLKYSTESYSSVEIGYSDRYIMPAEIRRAIKPCSDAKVTEIKQEIRSLAGIFEKLEGLSEEDRILPLDMERLPLMSGEISALMKQGYLRIYKEQYYLPEIIRLHFGFSYQTGARPKVLALLIK